CLLSSSPFPDCYGNAKPHPPWRPPSHATYSVPLHDALPISPDVIERLGDKASAKKEAEAADVPIVPGSKKPSEDAAEISRIVQRSEEHTSELQSRENLVCRLLLEKKN